MIKENDRLYSEDVHTKRIMRSVSRFILLM